MQDCAHPSECHNDADLKRQLTRALLHFQDRLLEANTSPGSLCQVRIHAAGANRL